MEYGSTTWDPNNILITQHQCGKILFNEKFVDYDSRMINRTD